MRTDTERLDWLTQNTLAYIAHSKDGDSCWVVWPYGTTYESFDRVRQFKSYNSVREAIDAAMDKTDAGE